MLVEKGADPKKTEVVYNWSYSDNLYNYEDVYSKKIAEFLPADKFNVVYAGNIGTMQNVDVVVAAARRMQEEKKIHFHIFGDGVYKKRLQSEAEGLTNISFWPMQPSELAPSIYAMADVNVIPLATNIYRTALPSKTATCIACQKPIIFCIGKDSRFGKKMKDQEGYYLVNSSDSDELRDTILKIENLHPYINSSVLYKEMFAKTENSKKYSELIVASR